MASFRNGHGQGQAPMHTPYSLNVSCQRNHLGYIIGKGGKVIESLIKKWNGKIYNIFVKEPEPQFGRPSHHLTIVGEEKAVHILALEINEMIKISMGRTETRLLCDINKADKKLQCQHATNLKIALLEEEIRILKEATEEKKIETEWGKPNITSWGTELLGSEVSGSSDDIDEDNK